MGIQVKNGINKINGRGLALGLLLTCCLEIPVYAQNDNHSKINATGVDSDAVENLFLSALREKTIENKIQAADLFNKILVIDPANDAALYELANIDSSKFNAEALKQVSARL